MLVDFYERLTRIEGKVGRIRENVGMQREVDIRHKLKIDRMGEVLVNKPDRAIEQIQHQNSK